MRIYRSVLEPKYFTVKQWKKFDKLTDDYVVIDGEKNYLTMQEVLLAKYQIILTDYKVNPILQYKGMSKKELVLKIAKNFNKKNFDKGMKIFDEGVKGFTNSIDAVTSQLGNDHVEKTIKSGKVWSNKKEGIKIWGSSPKVKIWPDHPKPKKTKQKRKRVQNPLHSNKRFRL